MKQLITLLAIGFCSCEQRCRYEVLQESKEPHERLELGYEPEIVEFEEFLNYGTPIDTSAATSHGKVVDIEITESGIEMPVFRVDQRKKDTSDPSDASE